MSEINIKRFVDVNILPSVFRSVSSTRDIVVLFTEEGTTSTTVTFSSYAEAAAALDNTDFATTLAYLKVYFDNGGQKCQIVEGVTFASLTAADILAFENEKIIFCFAYTAAALATGYAKVCALATALAADSSVYGINEKILLTRTNTTDTTSIKNLGVKYSNILGAEMTMAAYLSQIDVYSNNSVFDYMFTPETLTAEVLTDSTFGSILDSNMNVDITLAGATRNMGGNLKDGGDITNNYVRIILHQTLTARLLNLLASKIKGAKGVSSIYNVISQELENYLSCGYLITDKIWTKENLTIVYNSVTYTIIEKGTPITTGYYITVLPFSSLTAADKEARKAPPIYVVLADQYGIRAITIQGEVI